jgi:hypothetical protein
MVLLNCAVDSATVQPTYRKPFDLIFERTKNEDWSGREDLNLRGGGGSSPFKSINRKTQTFAERHTDRPLP